MKYVMKRSEDSYSHSKLFHYNLVRFSHYLLPYFYHLQTLAMLARAWFKISQLLLTHKIHKADNPTMQYNVWQWMYSISCMLQTSPYSSTSFLYSYTAHKVRIILFSDTFLFLFLFIHSNNHFWPLLNNKVSRRYTLLFIRYCIDDLTSVSKAWTRKKKKEHTQLYSVTLLFVIRHISHT